jgi:hypothetical protein
LTFRYAKGATQAEDGQTTEGKGQKQEGQRVSRVEHWVLWSLRVSLRSCSGEEAGKVFGPDPKGSQMLGFRFGPHSG